ncbi:nodulation protein NolO-like [Lytechinus pictus]|uniref:nodulation protein NolO-like n=1 Tax=Lytechinus pictus TaxID=7653 RepID=UPI0030BA01B4
MPAIIAFHTLHDANVTICEDGKLLAVLELERLFAKRYFCSGQRKSVFTEQWQKAIEVITKFTGLSSFDVAVCSWVLPSQREILKTLVKAEKWIMVDHHKCHATMGLYDSPFTHPLILSYDGGGNDGTFNVYQGNRQDGVKLIEKVRLNLGSPYRQVALAMPEVTGQEYDPESITTFMRFAPLALSGKVMGYAALGNVRDEWIPHFYEFYQDFLTPLMTIYNLGERLGVSLELNALDNTIARDVAATSQHVFTQLLLEQVSKFLDLYRKANNSDPDGIVLTGGCALNVHANQSVIEEFGLPVHVASAPNDCGISLGAAWSVECPKDRCPTLYSGLPLFDGNYLDAVAGERGASKATIAEVASLLVKGAIIGIVRGRQEFGPRALGHRSLVCYPNRLALKEEINKLKSREWFRPLCPAITERSAARMFLGRESSRKKRCKPIRDSSPPTPQSQVVSPLCLPAVQGDSPSDWMGLSPYMSFAPSLTEEAKQLFPAIAHYDGTARLQTVSSSSEPWFYSLLEKVGKQANDGGYEILLNTSFNIKGQPILNHMSTALEILDSSPEDTMTHVLIEDWLFIPRRKKTSGDESI